MDRNISVIDYLPQVLRNAKEMKAINNVENPILEEEWKLAFEQLENQFVLTANEAAIARYEKMLSIKINQDDNLETRRLRILSMISEQVPYTFKSLKRMLDSLLGEGNYFLERDVAIKNLNVFVELAVYSQVKILESMLERIIPVNMTYNVSQRFNTHSYVGSLTHFDLMNYTHKEIREDVLTTGDQEYDGLNVYSYDFLSSYKYSEIWKGDL